MAQDISIPTRPAQRALRSFAPLTGHPADPFSDPRAATAAILRLARRRRLALLAAQRGRLWAARSVAVAPARAFRKALEGVRKYGRVTQEDTGVSPLRQFAWAWWLNVRHHYEPHTVYRFRLFSPERALPRPGFMQFEEAVLLFRTVIPRVAREAAEILADKRRFAEWCRGNGIRTPANIAEFEDGAVTRRGQCPPGVDLFAKWGTRYGGGATQRWLARDGRYVDDEGHAWELEEIVASLAERSREGVVLLQPRLVNHPAFHPLSPNALSTIRVMTTRRPREAPRFLAGVLRMGTGSSTADNFAQGGIASAVDAETGVAGEARRTDKSHRVYVYHSHPDTGAPIAGFAIPYWREAVELALEAHARLGDVPCIGWDVAVLEDGPVLLEGNWNPCTKLLQVATQVPLLETEFAYAYAAWLAEPECAVDDDFLVAHHRWKPVT